MSKEEKLSEKFLIFVGRCNGASLTEFNISNFNDEARIIANGIDRYEKHIADLEAQIAEKDAERELDNSFWKQECDSLQKALAEKTLTIEQINKAFIENRSLWKGKYERANQDKISFAVEQLEQLKKLCQEKFNWWENSEWEGDIYDKCDVSNAYFDIEANVDNQIEELKKEMK